MLPGTRPTETPRPTTGLVALIALAVAIRLIIWNLMPDTRFASDEDAYFSAGVSLATRGVQDVFWPPVPGWLVASVLSICSHGGLRYTRLVWVAMDLAAACFLWVLARRTWEQAMGRLKANRTAFLVVLAYLLYLPAISFSQFATTETPAVLLVLATLVCLTSTAPRPTLRYVTAGLLIGTLVLTRTNLAPVLVTLPLVLAIVYKMERPWLRVARVLTLAIPAFLVVGLWLWRNHEVEGRLFLSANSNYNFAVGNTDVYQEDLNLFSPAATPEHIGNRKILRSGKPLTASDPLPTAQETIQSIKDHKARFLRRVLGRMGRIFVPRTDQLELIGGERRTGGVFYPPAVALLLVTNVQWVVVLVFGLVGLLSLARVNRQNFILFIGIILGAIPLCLVAISKPRYGFIFEPLLLMCSVVFFVDPAGQWRGLTRRMRLLLYGLLLFFAWSWVAWLIFCLTSRV